jgi:hypothetical protein
LEAGTVLDPKIVRFVPKLVRATQQAMVRFGPRPPAGTDPRIYQARPWMHDYTALGLTTDFSNYPSLGERCVNLVRGALGKGVFTTQGSHGNQKVRDVQILPALDRAFALHLENHGPVTSFLDTFSNDGFYAFWVAERHQTPRITCVELNIDDVRKGRLMASVLKKPEVEFICQDVHDMDATPVDIALCMGGLYHVTDPDAVVTKLRAKAKYLVAHSVTSTLSNDPAYFVSPAPYLVHGCRFSHEYFLSMLARAGWKILQSGHAVYPNPTNEHSAGSSWALCA